VTAPRTVPAVASTALAPLLFGPRRPLRVLAAFPAAVYLATDDGHVLGLVARDGVHHPNALVLTEPTSAGPLAGYRPHQEGHVGGGEVVLADRRTVVRRWSDPVPHVETTTAARLDAATGAARLHLAVVSGPVPIGLAEGAAEVAEALAAGDRDEAVAAARGLVGLGPGLTPAGDDVLSGLLSGTLVLAGAVGLEDGTAEVTRAAGADIADRAREATTTVSAALLAHAARAEVSAPAAGVLHALCGRGVVTTALERLLGVGSTSGRDLAVGLLAAADLVVALAPPAPTDATTPTVRTPGSAGPAGSAGRAGAARDSAAATAHAAAPDLASRSS
jgi:hypothetical protein